MLAEHNDPREVVTDEHARYFGTELGEGSLVPAGEAMLGQTNFDDWSGDAGNYPVARPSS